MELKEYERIDNIPGTELKIIQDKNRFSYGIDAILLSSFAKIKSGSYVMDLGTGTGIIPLRLQALYKPERIIGVEIQKDMAEMASRSVYMNELGDKIDIINMDLRDIPYSYKKSTFDAITSNPPYIKSGSGILNPEKNFALSRHEISCTLEDIIKISQYLLKDKGKLYLVHRPNRLSDIFWTAREYGIEPKTLQFIHPKAQEAPNLVLLECVKGGNIDLKVEKPLVVYDDKGVYTEEIYLIYGMKKENKNE